MAKIVLALAGEIASGKGAVTDYLIKKYDAGSMRYSSILRDILDRLYIEHTRVNLQQLSTFIRQAYGEDTLSKAMMQDIQKDDHEIVVLDGVRRPEDLININKLKGFKFIYVDADIKTRFERIIKRGENSDDTTKTFEAFKADHELESEVQIRGLKTIADFVVDNNGTQQQLFDQINRIISQLKKT